MNHPDIPKGAGDPDFYGYPGDVARLQERQIKEIFFTSPEFKQAEKERVESARPKEHEYVDFSRVYCPVYDKIRPGWLCESEHGDNKGEDWSEFDG